MQNPIQKFRQNTIVFEKPGFLSEKLTTSTNSNYHRVEYFLLKFFTSPTYQRVFGFFYFVEILKKKKKIKKRGF